MEVLAIVTMASSPPLIAIVAVVSRHGHREGGRLDLFVVAHDSLVMCPIERNSSAKSTLVPWTWMVMMARRSARVTMVTQTGLVLFSNFIDQCW